MQELITYWLVPYRLGLRFRKLDEQKYYTLSEDGKILFGQEMEKFQVEIDSSYEKCKCAFIMNEIQQDAWYIHKGRNTFTCDSKNNTWVMLKTAGTVAKEMGYQIDNDQNGLMVFVFDFPIDENNNSTSRASEKSVSQDRIMTKKVHKSASISMESVKRSGISLYPDIEDSHRSGNISIHDGVIVNGEKSDQRMFLCQDFESDPMKQIVHQMRMVVREKQNETLVSIPPSAPIPMECSPMAEATIPSGTTQYQSIATLKPVFFNMPDYNETAPQAITSQSVLELIQDVREMIAEKEEKEKEMLINEKHLDKLKDEIRRLGLKIKRGQDEITDSKRIQEAELEKRTKRQHQSNERPIYQVIVEGSTIVQKETQHNFQMGNSTSVGITQTESVTVQKPQQKMTLMPLRGNPPPRASQMNFN